uniref:Uncharacterized protein n=1 Tax=Arundo donax TaxID=35708 RepID=A0A0A9D216_ARUDO
MTGMSGVEGRYQFQICHFDTLFMVTGTWTMLSCCFPLSSTLGQWGTPFNMHSLGTLLDVNAPHLRCWPLPCCQALAFCRQRLFFTFSITFRVPGFVPPL